MSKRIHIQIFPEKSSTKDLDDYEALLCLRAAAAVQSEISFDKKVKITVDNTVLVMDYDD